MIDRAHTLPLIAQVRQFGICRGSIYYLPRPVADADLTVMPRIDELRLLYPFAGSRMLRDLLRQGGRRWVGCLVAIVDWFMRRVLAWRVSISLDAEFCIEALEEALARHGKPAIFNSDQGSQFTSTTFHRYPARQEDRNQHER